MVIKTRQHLAAVKPQGDGLMLELMHFSNELIDVDEFKLPATKDVGKKELQMAEALVNSMSDKWEPEEFTDEYKEALEKVIEEKIEKGGKLPAVSPKKVKATNVIDLVSVLQKSLERSGSSGSAGGGSQKKKTKAVSKKAAKAKHAPHRKAA